LRQLKPNLGDVPEGCVALILTHLDPPEICKLAWLNRAFRGASSADFVWESKLHPEARFERTIRAAENLFDEMQRRDAEVFLEERRLCFVEQRTLMDAEIWKKREERTAC
jgi:hypothetical protein